LRLVRRLRWPHVVVAASLAGLSACGGSSSDDAAGSQPLANCGNGKVQAAEQCDDGNVVGGDGCASTCFVEDGWRCEETTPSGLSTCGRLVGAHFADDPVSGRLSPSTLLPEGRDSSDASVPTRRTGLTRESTADADINGDGRPDLVLNSGPSVVVIFGRDAGVPAELDIDSLLPENGGDGSDGFWLRHLRSAWHGSYGTIAVAGDVNGDGFDDIVAGDPYSSPHGLESAGRAFIVYGCAGGFPAEGDLESLSPENGGDGSAGFVVTGSEAFGYTGSAIAPVGDVNGDGLDDLLIGAPVATPVAGREHAGDPYLILGRRAAAPCESSTLKPVVTSRRNSAVSGGA
jgi:cysteine-rich repeat protein